MLFAGVLAWAVFVRVWGVSRRPFWMDEAAIANVVTDLSWQQLIQQTDLPVAPLFAVATKLASSILLPPEVSLRLLPMVCGILLVPLVYLMMRTLNIRPAVSLVAMTLCASSPWLVIWSRELKQYEIEAFLSVLLALFVFRLRRCTSAKQRWPVIAAIIAICVFGPWFGYGLIFSALTLVGILILLKPIAIPRKITLLTGLIALCILFVSVILMMHISVADQAAHKALLSYMGNWFINPISLRSWARAAVYGLLSSAALLVPFSRHTSNIFVGPALGAVIWIVVLFGLKVWQRESRIEFACLTIGPWLLLLAAALAQKYPFGAVRMMVFVAPPMAAASAMALANLCCSLSSKLGGKPENAYIAAFILAALPAVYIVNIPTRLSYWVNHDFRQVLDVLRQERKGGETVIVALDAVQPVRFYSRGQNVGFEYVPCIGGTRPVPGYDYNYLTYELLKNAGQKWWLLTTTFETDPTRQAIFENAQKWRYHLELIKQAGGDRIFGQAQLFTATKQK